MKQNENVNDKPNMMVYVMEFEYNSDKLLYKESAYMGHIMINEKNKK